MRHERERNAYKHAGERKTPKLDHSLKNKQLLLALQDANDATRKAILKSVDKGHLEAVTDCLKILLQNNSGIIDDNYRDLRWQS